MSAAPVGAPSGPSVGPAPDADVVVVGGGNAALCAALSARGAGASVVLLERAPRRERGGNPWFSAGVFRAAYADVAELESVSGELGDEVRPTTDFGAGSYPRAEFHDDLVPVAESRCDPELTRVLVEHSLESLRWIREHGVRFVPAYARRSFLVDGVRRFWGGHVLQTEGAGPGLVDGLYRAAEEAGVEVKYETGAVGLELDAGRVRGVRCLQGGSFAHLRAHAVVLAAGGFEANAEWRARYLGPGWDLAKVRGTRCGITFTSGGLKGDDRARVLDVAERPVEGLFAAGELVGGLFYFNYPGGSGLTGGAVFGQIAGREAAAFAVAGRCA